MAIHHNITLDRESKRPGQQRARCSCGKYTSSWFYHERGALDAGNYHKNQKERTTIVNVRKITDHQMHGRLLARFEPVAAGGYDCVVIREDPYRLSEMPFLSAANVWEEKPEGFEVGKKYVGKPIGAKAIYEVVDIRQGMVLGWWWYEDIGRLNQWHVSTDAINNYKLK